MTIEPSDTIKIIVCKRRTVNRGNVKSFGSSQVNIGVEADVPLSNIEAEFKRCINYVDTTLEAEMTKELAKLNHSIQTDQSAQLDENVTPQKPVRELEKRSPVVPMADDPYAALPWRRSAKHPQLSMVLVTSELSELGRDLYKKLERAESKTLRSSNATYKLWLTSDWAQFLQRWSKAPKVTT
jgi:hypothetical protein